MYPRSCQFEEVCSTPDMNEPEKRRHCSASSNSKSCVRRAHSRHAHDIGLGYKMALNGLPTRAERYSRQTSEGRHYPRQCRWLCALRLVSLHRTRACLPVGRCEAGRLPRPLAGCSNLCRKAGQLPRQYRGEQKKYREKKTKRAKEIPISTVKPLCIEMNRPH